MNTRLRRTIRGILAAVVVTVVGFQFDTRTVAAAAPDEVINWNVIATSVGLPGGLNAIQQSRVYAMSQLAVHDALNNIERRYSTYAFSQEENPRATPAAAVATAAHDVLVNQVPAQAGVIEAAWIASLAALASGPEKDAGIAIGHASAAAILARRSADGSTTVTPYAPGTGPGEWRPTPNPVPPSPPGPELLPAILPGWGNVVPFALRSGAQFRPAGPPSLTSRRYTNDFNEVKEVGEQFSVVRTPEQSEIAQFWYEGSPNGWNRIARSILADRSLNPWKEARLLALLNVAMADGFIAGFNAKYVFNFWRPVTAIREADTDGNDDTISDASWSTYLNTPAIPDYPSTQGVLGGAASAVLALFFRTDHVAFTTTSGAPFPGITRSFRSLSQAALENANARVYAGIHFRTACADGVRQGRLIGVYAFATLLQPRHPHNDR